MEITIDAIFVEPTFPFLRMDVLRFPPTCACIPATLAVIGLDFVQAILLPFRFPDERTLSRTNRVDVANRLVSFSIHIQHQIAPLTEE